MVQTLTNQYSLKTILYILKHKLFLNFQLNFGILKEQYVTNSQAFDLLLTFFFIVLCSRKLSVNDYTMAGVSI